MGRIAFLARGVPHAFRQKSRLTRWLNAVARDHGTSIGELCFVLLGDEQLRDYNRRFLGRSYYTDVIAFDGPPATGASGDILISYDRTRENAARYGASHQQELRRVMLHGLLHLLGHRDDTRARQRAMRRAEDKYLLLY